MTNIKRISTGSGSIEKLDQQAVSRKSSSEQVDQDQFMTNFKWNFGGESVYLTGTFTNWQNHKKMEKVGKDFHLIIKLARGIYQYKFIVDGEWRFSPNDNTFEDDHGNINNVIDTTHYNQFAVNHEKNIGGPINTERPSQLFKAHGTQPLTKVPPTKETKQSESGKDMSTMDTAQQKSGVQKFHSTTVSPTFMIANDIMKRFDQDAPEVPQHLLEIQYLTEHKRKVQDIWQIHSNDSGQQSEQQSKEMKNETSNQNQNQENKDQTSQNQMKKTQTLGILRAFETFNALSPPPHVTLNHIGVKQNTDDEFFTYVITQRFKGKYSTMKFFTNIHKSPTIQHHFNKGLLLNNIASVKSQSQTSN